MSKVKEALSGLRYKLSSHKNNMVDSLHSKNNGEIRGGSEDIVAHKIQESEPVSEESDDDDDHQGPAKSLDDFLDNDDPQRIRARYGQLPLMKSQENPVNGATHEQWIPLKSVSTDQVDKEVTFRARVHIVRHMSAKLAFIIFREQIVTVQGVLTVREGLISENMVRWAEHIRPGSIVIVRGTVQRAMQRVKTTTTHDVEIMINELHIQTARTAPVPFSVYEAEATTDGHAVSDRVRLSNRILDLRTPTSQSIFRIQAGVCNMFRSYLDDRGFIEIHTPKLQGGATEGGASVFKIDYFGRPAFLAQSPQLAKQMCIAADFNKVYEIGPVFRAGKSKLYLADLIHTYYLQRTPIPQGT